MQGGSVTAGAFFVKARLANDALTWMFRIVGFLMMVGGLTSVASPIVAVMEYVPGLGPCFASLASCGAVMASCAIAVPLTALTVASAWIYFRPVFAMTLVMLAVTLVAGGVSMHNRAGGRHRHHQYARVSQPEADSHHNRRPGDDPEAPVAWRTHSTDDMGPPPPYEYAPSAPAFDDRYAPSAPPMPTGSEEHHKL